MKKVLLLFAFFLISGCADSGSHEKINLMNSMGKDEGIIMGTVNFEGLECAPGTSKGPPCSGPYPNFEVSIYKEDGKSIAKTAKTDSMGEFEAPLEEGNYVIYTQSGVKSRLPNNFIVRKGKATLIALTVDTGIR